MPTLNYLCGPPGSGKTTLLLQRYLQAVSHNGSDAVLWLVPDAATAAALRARVTCELGGLYDPRLLTFPALAHSLLNANHQTVRELEPCQRELLVRHLAALDSVGLPEKLRELPGFISALCSFMDELKRAAVDPVQFQHALHEDFPADTRAAALGRFYAAYQRHLETEGLFDEPGLFWWARSLLADGRRAPFGQVRLVLVDGFTDFTTTQLQVLRHLAEAVDETIITLALAPHDGREALFAAPQRLLKRLQGTVGEGAVTWLAPCTTRPEPLQHLLAQLFLLQPAATDAGGRVRLMAAPGVLAEVRETLREVKNLLLEGVRPGQIGLIFRSLDGYRRALQEAAREMGVPLLVAGSESLTTRPPVQAVLDLLQVVEGDYRQPDVVKLLKSNFVDLAVLQEGQPVAPEEVEWVACEARVIGGRRNWQEQLTLYGNRLQREWERSGDEDEEGERLRPRWQIELERALRSRCAGLFDRLVERLDRLSRPQTRREHVRRLLELLEDLALPRRLVHAAAGPEMAANVAAYQQLLESLRAYAQADRVLPQQAAGTVISFETFAAELRALAQGASYDGPAPVEGQVVALDILSARQLRKPYLFIGGLVEGQWPVVRREQPFFDDRERGRLQRAAIALDLSADQQQEEAYLFYLACAAAEERLYLTYPTVDAEGQPLPCTHYVEEVSKLFLSETLPVRQRKLAQVVVEAEQVACLRELLERVEQQNDPALRVAAKAAAGGGLDLAQHVLECATIEKQRHSREPLETHDGVLESPRLRQMLSQRFGPGRRWSATALGAYGNCPFRFFVDRVLHLDTVQPPAEEVEALDLGTVIHRILYNFFLGHPRGQALQAGASEADQARMDRLVDQIFGEWETRGLVTHRALWRLAREQARRDLRQLLDHELEKLGDYLPHAFEAIYETTLPAPEDGGEPLIIHGKMDRVDLSRDGSGFAVYDYKGGDGNPPTAILAGAEFQMPFYTMGAQAAVFGGQDPPPACTRWAYYRYRTPVRLAKIVTAEPRSGYLAIPDYVHAAITFAYRHVRSIRQGDFALNPQSCLYCEFSEICRYTPHRVDSKKGEGRP